MVSAFCILRNLLYPVHEDILLFSSKNMTALAITFEFACGVRYSQGLLFSMWVFNLPRTLCLLKIPPLFNTPNCSRAFVVNPWAM